MVTLTLDRAVAGMAADFGMIDNDPLKRRAGVRHCLQHATQVNFLVPDGSAAGIATVTIGSSSGTAQIDSVRPGVYSMNGDGKGVAAANAALYSAAGNMTPVTSFQCLAGSPCVAVPLDLGGATINWRNRNIRGWTK